MKTAARTAAEEIVGILGKHRKVAKNLSFAVLESKVTELELCSDLSGDRLPDEIARLRQLLEIVRVCEDQERIEEAVLAVINVIRDFPEDVPWERFKTEVAEASKGVADEEALVKMIIESEEKRFIHQGFVLSETPVGDCWIRPSRQPRNLEPIINPNPMEGNMSKEEESAPQSEAASTGNENPSSHVEEDKIMDDMKKKWETLSPEKRWYGVSKREAIAAGIGAGIGAFVLWLIKR